MPTLYVDLLRLIAAVDWNNPENVRQALTEVVRLIEEKLISLNTRVTGLGG